MFGNPLEMAKLIRRTVKEKENVLCSIGVATNKMIAKLASKAAKPKPSLDGIKPGQGVVLVEAGQELEFLHPMPVSALWGIGPATEKVVRKLGAETVGDIAALPVATLVGALGKSHGTHIAQLARGIDSNTIAEKQEAKSISHEMTFLEDRFTHDEIRKAIWQLSEKVGTRLRAASKYARHVGIRVRHGDFTSYTTGAKLPVPTQSTQAIAAEAMALLEKHDVSMGVRLVGVKVSELTDDGSAQLSFGESLSYEGGNVGSNKGSYEGSYEGSYGGIGADPTLRSIRRDSDAKLDHAIDAIRSRYGARAIQRAVAATETVSSGVGFVPLASIADNGEESSDAASPSDSESSADDLTADDLAADDLTDR